MSTYKEPFMKNLLSLVVSVSCVFNAMAESGPLREPPSSPVALLREPAAGVSSSLQNEATAAISRGVKWLIARQNEEGYWSNPEFPALTALSLWAIAKSGNAPQEAVDRAVGYILASVHEDGSIWRKPSEERRGGGLSTYNTAISMVALHMVGRADLVPVIQNARRFLAGAQHFGGDVYEGGMGYDASTGRAYADLSNTMLAYEAMRLTESVEDLRTGPDGKADLDWEAARKFLARVQNLPGQNAGSWVSDDEKERGGFIYTPESSQAGTYTDAEGVVRFRTYASMTYAGLLSLIYAEVDRNDPRVQSAFDWAQRHWTLDENPGMGKEGLYYFYNVLAKALATYGQDVIRDEAGNALNWREEFIRKLVNLQRVDADTGEGYWLNETGRWWESDPVLVTAYSLIALEVALAD